MKFLTALVVPYLLLVSVNADYQLEIRILSYMNPGGRTDAGPCCEPMAVDPTNGMCLSQDTCDTRFSFQVQNFHRVELIGVPIVVSNFTNMNTITFLTCGAILGEIQNPLVFTFSTSAYNATSEFLRVMIEISDVDEDPRTNEASVVPIVTPGSQVLEIGRGSVSAVFSNQTLGGAVLTNLALALQYRLICTPGSCGEDCTQTTGCTPYPPACPPVDPVCGEGMPCINGGMCQNGVCRCLRGFTGSTCQSTVMTPPPSTTPTNPIPSTMRPTSGGSTATSRMMVTVTEAEATSTSTGSNGGGGSGGGTDGSSKDPMPTTISVGDSPTSSQAPNFSQSIVLNGFFYLFFFILLI